MHFWPLVLMTAQLVKPIIHWIINLEFILPEIKRKWWIRRCTMIPHANTANYSMTSDYWSNVRTWWSNIVTVPNVPQDILYHLHLSLSGLLQHLVYIFTGLSTRGLSSYDTHNLGSKTSFDAFLKLHLLLKSFTVDQRLLRKMWPVAALGFMFASKL